MPLIVSASYRTDIPAFYGEWFRNRRRAGFARVRNPYGGPSSVVPLCRPDVDGFVFWTRNALPFLPALREVADDGLPFAVQFTITGYPRALDAATIAADRAVEQVRRITAEYGEGTVVWRYDPIVFSSITPADWHVANVSRLADALAGLVDEVVVSIVQLYRKTTRNLRGAACTSGFSWSDPTDAEKRRLLARLTIIAADRAIRLTLCDQAALRGDGIGEARCIDARRLSRHGGRSIAAPLNAHRPTCGCYASRDIGDYDSCPQGCAYCYAVTSRSAARTRLARHDPAGEFLLPRSARDSGAA
jgi:Domain of unknown function (DUF1848)